MMSFVMLKATNLAKTAAVFEALGVTFETEQHGNGPVHLASRNLPVVLEIYPAAQMQGQETMIGIDVDDVVQARQRCVECGIEIAQDMDLENGLERLILAAPDGYRVFVQKKA